MSPDLEHKVNEATEFMTGVLQSYTKPAIMLSFGKDSMAIAYMLLFEMGLTLPVIAFKEPWFQRKNQFAHMIAAAWNLDIYDWPPLDIKLIEGDEGLAYANFYQFGVVPAAQAMSIKYITEPVPDSSEPWLCYVNDVAARPRGTFITPWDVAFCGSKDSDTDYVWRQRPLRERLVKNPDGVVDVAFPLKGWTDADVWAYSQARKIPVQPDRYFQDLENQWRERDDHRTNPDWTNVCTLCVDRKLAGQQVHCPLAGKPIANMSHLASYVERDQQRPVNLQPTT